MTHRETSYAQIALTAIFFTGYFLILRDFVHGKISVPTEWKDTLQGLLEVLTSGVLMILTYWFQRQRTSNDPPPPKAPTP